VVAWVFVFLDVVVFSFVSISQVIGREVWVFCTGQENICLWIVEWDVKTFMPAQPLNFRQDGSLLLYIHQFLKNYIGLKHIVLLVFTML